MKHSKKSKIRKVGGKKRKPLKEKKMLGCFNGKLDKNTSIVSLVIISLITFSIATSNLFSVFNISGIFKQ